jgi:hypothetical protein
MPSPDLLARIDAAIAELQAIRAELASQPVTQAPISVPPSDYPPDDLAP